MKLKQNNQKVILYLCLAFISCLISTRTFGSEWVIQSQTYRQHQRVPENQVYQSLGCQGKNKSPDIQWTGAPAGTQSFAITLYDPDAPTGSGWWHWTVFNLPATTTGLPEGASGQTQLLPAGAIEGKNDFGKVGYGGPCPPIGTPPHRYILTVYALKVPKLYLNEESTPAMLGLQLNAHQLAKVEIVSFYDR